MSIYFDNNATTFIDKDTEDMMHKCVNLGNPSSTNAKSIIASKIISTFKNNILKIVNGVDFETIVNSGASEGNSHIIQGVVNQYWNTYKSKPHIIVSAIEHDSIGLCVDYLKQIGRCDLTKIDVGKSCIVNPSDIATIIRPNTILVSIMGANNETGAINPIKLIGSIIKKIKPDIYFHSDMTQYFGKIPIDINDLNLDFMTASMHKVYGPPGIGIIVKRVTIEIPPLIFGTQQNFCRGGTENIIAIGGANHALVKMNIDHIKKMLELKNYLINELKTKFNTVWYDSVDVPESYKGIVVLTPSKVLSICNTLLISLVGKCNIKVKKFLESKGIIVSIGSACDATIGKSATITSMKVPNYITSGIIRISFGKYNTITEINKLIKYIKKIINE